ncbi:MAG: hypothetical protein ACI9KE_003075 [Polyangiales bacterium]|jgi:hypothetical protein
MESVIMGVATAIGVSVGLAIHRSRQAKQNGSLSERITPHLVGEGKTLPELKVLLGMNSFIAGGKVVMALGEMVKNGSVEEIPAPAGTPQLEKVEHIRYRAA